MSTLNLVLLVFIVVQTTVSIFFLFYLMKLLRKIDQYFLFIEKSSYQNQRISEALYSLSSKIDDLTEELSKKNKKGFFT